MAAPAAGFQSFPTPFAVADHARFFESWLRRIAPDTHVDQASGDESACRPGGFAAPEERWCRNASNGFTQTRGCRCLGAIPLLAHVAGDPLVLQTFDGARRPIQTRWLVFQSPILAHRFRRNSCEAARHVERLALLQNVEAGPRQLVRQRLDRHHVVRLCLLPLVETFRLGAVAQREVGRLDEGPC